jgi:hypothetical protein
VIGVARHPRVARLEKRNVRTARRRSCIELQIGRIGRKNGLLVVAQYPGAKLRAGSPAIEPFYDERSDPKDRKSHNPYHDWYSSNFICGPFAGGLAIEI